MPSDWGLVTQSVGLLQGKAEAHIDIQRKTARIRLLPFIIAHKINMIVSVHFFEILTRARCRLDVSEGYSCKSGSETPMETDTRAE